MKIFKPSSSGLVEQLRSLGEPQLMEWLDYPSKGLTAAHIPELIEIIRSIDDFWDDVDDSSDTYLPVHAWRALGQLHAVEAIEPLVDLFDAFDPIFGNELLAVDLPEVFGLIGPAAIPALVAYAQNEENNELARLAAVGSLGEIALYHPQNRDGIVALLSNLLSRYQVNGPAVNATIISMLVDLNAVEAAPIMEQAFAAHAVDLNRAGNWHEVQVDLGLKDPSEPRPWEASMGEFMRQRAGYNPWDKYESDDPDMTAAVAFGNIVAESATIFRKRILALDSKTSYYLSSKASTANLDSLANANNLAPLFIRAVCAYL